MKQEISEVRDRPAEIWIKLLVGVTSLLVALISYGGNRVISGMDDQLREMSEINGNLKAFESRLSRAEQDIQIIYHNIKLNGEK